MAQWHTVHHNGKKYRSGRTPAEAVANFHAGLPYDVGIFERAAGLKPGTLPRRPDDSPSTARPAARGTAPRVKRVAVPDDYNDPARSVALTRRNPVRDLFADFDWGIPDSTTAPPAADPRLAVQAAFFTFQG